jgi:hypothetical protein
LAGYWLDAHGAGLALDGRIWFGLRGAYDPRTQAWSQTPTPLSYDAFADQPSWPYWDGAIAVSGDLVWIAGGCCASHYEETAYDGSILDLNSPPFTDYLTPDSVLANWRDAVGVDTEVRDQLVVGGAHGGYVYIASAVPLGGAPRGERTGAAGRRPSSFSPSAAQRPSVGRQLAVRFRSGRRPTMALAPRSANQRRRGPDAATHSWPA